jgi:hypothetical protein
MATTPTPRPGSSAYVDLVDDTVSTVTTQFPTGGLPVLDLAAGAGAADPLPTRPAPVFNQRDFDAQVAKILRDNDT